MARPQPGDRVAVLVDRGIDGWMDDFGTIRGWNRDRRWWLPFRVYWIEIDRRGTVWRPYRRWDFTLIKPKR